MPGEVWRVDPGVMPGKGLEGGAGGGRDNHVEAELLSWNADDPADSDALNRAVIYAAKDCARMDAKHGCGLVNR
jgi:hypothetical protein